MLDRRPLDAGDLDFSGLGKQFDDLVYHDGTTADELAERLADREVAFTNKVVLDREALAAARRLRLVCLMATGTDNVDLAAAADLGIAVCHCRGYATPAVTQHVFALITALATNLPAYAAAVRRGDWQAAKSFCLLDYPIRELAGRRLGIIGYGELGRAVAGVAEAFGMQVLVARRPGSTGDANDGRLPLAELWRWSDIVSLHCPLTEDTRHLVDAQALAAMPPDAFLINTARGALVDERALATALREGQIAGAGVDVLSREPPDDDHPLLADDIPNLIVTPHSAWGSREARQRLVAQLVENIAAFRAGDRLRRVE